VGAGNTQDSRQDSRDDTIRRADFAVSWLSAILKSKIGKSFAYGDVLVRVRIQAGEIVSIKTNDESDYK
jgi:hypothetical protein